MNMMKNVVVGLVLLSFLSAFGILLAGAPLAVHAAETEVEEMAPREGMFEAVEDQRDPGLPTTTIEDINEWTERKGFEIIGLLQKFIQPFAIIVFIVCGFMALFGAFGNGKAVSAGIGGMVTALLIYVVVLYAPEIMDMFLGFLRS